MIIVYQQVGMTIPKNYVMEDISKDTFQNEEGFLRYIQEEIQNFLWEKESANTKFKYEVHVDNHPLPTIINIFK